MILIALLAAIACSPTEVIASPEAQPAETRATLPADPDEQLEVFGAWLREGEKDRILAHVDDTVRAFSERGDLEGQAMAEVVRGLALKNPGGGAQSRDALLRARDLLRLAEDPLSEIFVLWMVAEGEFNEGRAAEAEGLLDEALALIEGFRAGDGPFNMTGLAKLRAVSTGISGGIDQISLDGWLGDLSQQPVPDAMPPLLAALARPLMADMMMVPTLTSRSSVRIYRGDLDGGEADLQRAEGSSPLFRQLFAADLHLHRGELQRYRWQLDAARDSYRQALEAGGLSSDPSTPRGGRSRFSVYSRLSEVEMLAGRPEAALDWNRQALELARELESPEVEARFLSDRGLLWMQRGRYDQARETLERGVTVAEEADSRYYLAILEGDLGTLAFQRGHYQEAARHLERSRALLAELGEAFLESVTLPLLVESYVMLDAHERTGPLIERTLAVAEISGVPMVLPLARALRAWNEAVTEGGDRRQVVLHHMQELADFFSAELSPRAGELLLEADVNGLAQALVAILSLAQPSLGEPMVLALESAVRLQDGDAAGWEGLEQATRRMRQAGNPDLAGLFGAAVAAARWRAGEVEQGAAAMEAAVADMERALERIHVGELAASFMGNDGRRWAYGLHVELLTATGRDQEAFLQAERARARSLLRLLGNQRLRPVDGTDPALHAQAEALRQQITRWQEEMVSVSGPDRLRLAADLAEARQRYDHLRVRLKVQSEEYSALTSVEPATVEEIQASLRPGVTLVSYFVAPNGLYAWVVDRERFVPVPLAAAPAELKTAACWVRTGGLTRGGAPSDDCHDPELAQRLHAALIEPLLPHLSGERLIVVPHGPLHYLPFAALHGSDGRHLVETHRLSVVPSASVLPLLAAKESPVRGEALVFGAPTATDPDLKDLKHAREEAERIAGALGTSAHLGAAASEALLYEKARGSDLVHLAAHGLLLPASPRFSHLALAGDPGGEDGRLEVQEVFSRLDLSGVNLVVLSACETGVGPDEGGDEIVSLTRAFLYAGTPGVISTLWPVDDAASGLLMRYFYGHLRAGETAAAALREAQLDMIGEGGPFADPRYWAGYVLTGDPQGRWPTPSGATAR